MTIRLSTRDTIIEAAFQLYSEDPAASLADIAKRAGIGRATLHRHFKGRDELFAELALTALREIDTVAEEATKDAKSYTESLKNIMDALIPLANRHWFLYREPIEDYPEASVEIQRQTREMAEAIEEVKKEGGIDPGIPTTWVVQAFDNLIFAAWELVRSGEATPKQASDLAWQTFISGIGA